jgi:hypothetical protein
VHAVEIADGEDRALRLRGNAVIALNDEHPVPSNAMERSRCDRPALRATLPVKGRVSQSSSAAQ